MIVEHLPNSIQDVCLNSIYSCEHIDNDRGFQCSDSKEYRIFEIPTARRHDGVTDLNSMLWSYFHATIETPEKIIRSTRFITNFVRIFPISLPLFEENGTVNELPVTVKSHIDISKFDLTRTEYDLELYGVLYHSKSIGHGHYAISLKIKNRWFNFNDDRVTVECRNIPKKMDGMCIVGLLYVNNMFNFLSRNSPKIMKNFDDDENAFRHGSMDIINADVPELLQQYIRNAPPIEAITVAPREVPPIEFHPSPFGGKRSAKKIRDPNEPPKPKENKPKRAYQRVSYSQKCNLQRLYHIHNDDKNLLWYSAKTGISENNCKRYLQKIRAGQDILETHAKSGRPRKIEANYGKVLVSTLKKNPFINLKDLAEKYQSDTGENISSATIQRYIRKQAKEDGLPVFSFKKTQNRAPVANTPENKKIRKKACCRLMSYIQAGYDWVCIDETSFEVGYVNIRGWGETSKRVLNTKTIKGFRGTALFGISSTGMQYCLFIRGSVTQDIFNAFLKYLLAEIHEKENVVIWMDNASIHKKATVALEGTNHKVVFNAAYSPELNPIENVIGIWKGIVKKEVVKFNSESELIELIGKSFGKVNPADIRAAMEHIRNEIFRKVENEEDI